MFWGFFSFSVLFYNSSHVFLSPLQPAALEAGFHQEGPLCLSHRLSSVSATHQAREEWLKDRQSEISLKAVPFSHPQISLYVLVEFTIW